MASNENEETRPLLPTIASTGANSPGLTAGSSGTFSRNQPTIPPINTVVEKLRFEALHSNTDDFNVSNVLIRDTPLESLNEWERASYTICILLSFRQWYHELSVSNEESWEIAQWQRSNPNIAHDLDAQIVRKWKDLGYETSTELGQILWAKFLVKEGSLSTVRLIDLLVTSDHEDIICDPTLEQYLFGTWKKGISSGNTTYDSSESRIFQFYDTLAKPRAIYAMDLIVYLTYLVSLVYYVVSPPTRFVVTDGSPRIGLREAWITFYSFSSIFRPFPSLCFPSLLVFFSFIITLPASPYSDDFPFLLLLIALIIYIIKLHIPDHPSPAFVLFSIKNTLPLTTLIVETLSRALFPALSFIFPLFILSWILFSYLFGELRAWISLSTVFTITFLPGRTANTVLLLLMAEGLIFIWSIFVLAVSYITHRGEHLAGWDAYTRPIGLVSRRRFASALALYATPYMFPPPFNLISSLILIPLKVFLHLTGNTAHTETHVHRIQQVLWRLLVAPLAISIGAFWMWGLRS